MAGRYAARSLRSKKMIADKKNVVNRYLENAKKLGFLRGEFSHNNMNCSCWQCVEWRKMVARKTQIATNPKARFFIGDAA
jgi:hypothetical protein